MHGRVNSAYGMRGKSTRRNARLKRRGNTLRDLHAGQEHGHGFEAIEAMSPADVERVMLAVAAIELAVPPINDVPQKFRDLFGDWNNRDDHDGPGRGMTIPKPLQMAIGLLVVVAAAWAFCS